MPMRTEASTETRTSRPTTAPEMVAAIAPPIIAAALFGWRVALVALGLAFVAAVASTLFTPQRDQAAR